MGKIKVVHLITRLDMGGAQGNTLYTVENLDPEKFEAHLWYGPGGYWDSTVASNPFYQTRSRIIPHLLRSLHPLWDLIVVFELANLMKKERPQIVHTHSSKAGIVGRLAAKLAGVPVVIHTFHGFGFNAEQKPWTRALFLFLERLTAWFTTALVFVSEANRREAEEKGIGNSTQYNLIRSGIPLGAFYRNLDKTVRTTIRQAWGLTSEPVLITVGPFKPQKNLSDFLTVCDRVRETHPTLKAYIVGDGEERAQLEALIAEKNLSSCVQLLGWRRDVADVMAVGTVFVMTSLWEGLPRALAEALASGLPAVCYDTDGVRDLLTKRGGVLVPKKDITVMSQQITALLSDPARQEQFSKEGPDLVKSEFDIGRMVRQQEDLYSSFLDKISRIN